MKPVDKNNKRKRTLKGFNNTYLDIEPHSGFAFNFHFDPRASSVVIHIQVLRTCKTVKFKGSYIELKLNQIITFDFQSLICVNLRYLRSKK